MEFAAIVLFAIFGFVAGTLEGPKIIAWFKAHSAAKAVTAAQALIAKAEADAAALVAAKKVVAAAPAPVAAPVVAKVA